MYLSTGYFPWHCYGRSHTVYALGSFFKLKNSEIYLTLWASDKRCGILITGQEFSPAVL